MGCSLYLILLGFFVLIAGTKAMNTLFPRRGVWFFLPLFAVSISSWSAMVGDDLLRNFDVRRERPSRPIGFDAQQNQAIARLRAKVAGLRVDPDDILLSPKFVFSTDGFLTKPHDGGVVADPHGPVKRFLDENRELFGHGAEVFAQVRLVRDYFTAHNGVRTIALRQQLDGIPVFQAVLRANLSKNGELICLSSLFLPDLEQAANRGTPNRQRIQRAPPFSAEQAVARAAAHLGITLTVSELSPGRLKSESAFGRRSFRADALEDEAEEEPVWFPLDRATLKLCWAAELAGRGRKERFQVLIDAQTGDVYRRQSLTSHVTPQKYEVFPSDSPSPFSPGHQQFSF